MRRFSALLVAVVICSAATAACAQRTYRNPIIDHMEAADPTVIRCEGKYYLYPTHGATGYHVFVSEDLVHWKRRLRSRTPLRRHGPGWPALDGLPPEGRQGIRLETVLGHRPALVR